MATKVTTNELNMTVQTAANSGTAGGTWSYVNIGGLKIATITTANLNSSAAGGQAYTFVPPSGFFTTILGGSATGLNQTAVAEQYANFAGALLTTGFTVRSLAGGTGTQALTVVIVGT